MYVAFLHSHIAPQLLQPRETGQIQSQGEGEGWVWVAERVRDSTVMEGDWDLGDRGQRGDSSWGDWTVGDLANIK